MSRIPRRYRRIEAFFSRIRRIAPDVPSRAPAETPAGRTDAASGSPAFPSPADGWPGFFSGAGRSRTTGFTFKQGRVTRLEETPLPLPENALRVPLTVSGKTVGSVQVAGMEAGGSSREIEIVGAVAALLERHLDDLTRPERNGAKKP